MKDEQAIQGLRDKCEAWRHADPDTKLDVYPIPMVAMLDAMFRKQFELEQEIKRLKGSVTYLTECHAANAEGSTPKRVSKHDRERFKMILEKAVDLLKGGWPRHFDLVREQDKLIERCEIAAGELEVE